MGEAVRTCFWLGVVLLQTVLISRVAATNSTTNVNDDGVLTFSAIPDDITESYSIGDGSFDEGSFPLPTTWAFIGSFLSTVSPGSPPYALINGLIGGTTALDLTLITGNVLEYKNNLLGFAICFVLGLLFVLIFPLVALCFCCCRCCCKKCGGKLHQDTADNSFMRCMVYSLCLLASITFVFAGAVTALCISGYTAETVKTLPDTVVNNIDDTVKYVNNTLNEINFVMGAQLTWTLDQVRNDLEGIGDEVGVPVRDALSLNVTPAIDAVIALESTINFTLYTLVDIESQQGDMETNWDYIATTLTSILGDLNTLCVSCSCCTASTAAKRTINIVGDYRDIVSWTEGSFPQRVVNESINQLRDIVANDLGSQAREGQQTFNDIPATLTNTTATDVASIIATIDELEVTLGELINETTFSLAGISDMVEPFKEQAREPLQNYADNLDKYRGYVMYVFYGFILFIVVLFLMGVLVGCCGYSRKALPTERSSVGNCGALFLMAGAGFVLIFGVLFMLITALSFIIGGPIDRLVCDPIVSRDIFTETIDKEDAIKPGYYLGELVFQDPTVPLTVSGILEDCENNEAVYSALKLENLFDIDNFTDISSQIPNVDDQFANITGDFSSVEILTDDTKQTLVDFRDSSADEIMWGNFTNELAKNFTEDGDGNANTLQILIDAVDADAVASPGDATELGYISGNLTNLQPMVALMLMAVDDIEVSIDLFTNTTSTIDPLVNDTIAAAEMAQMFIDDEIGNIVTEQVTTFSAKVLGYPEQFVNYTVDELTTNIGGCRPLYNLFNVLTNTICVGFLRSFNGLWFTLGWCIVFLMPSLIFGVKLAKYFRIMESTDAYDGDFEMHGYGNKVGPQH